MSLSFYPNNVEYLTLKDDHTFEYTFLTTGNRVSKQPYLETNKFIILSILSPDTFFKKKGNTLISKRGKVYYPAKDTQQFDDVASSQDEALSHIWDTFDIEKYDSNEANTFGSKITTS